MCFSVSSSEWLCVAWLSMCRVGLSDAVVRVGRAKWSRTVDRGAYLRERGPGVAARAESAEPGTGHKCTAGIATTDP